MISCLEKVSIEERHEQMLKSDYNRENPYDATLAHKDKNGKGTGHGGHSFWLPNCNGTLGAFNYSNFDTLNDAGNIDDRNARKVALARSMYNDKDNYNDQILDRSKNIMEGQYVMK